MFLLRVRGRKKLKSRRGAAGRVALFRNIPLFKKASSLRELCTLAMCELYPPPRMIELLRAYSAEEFDWCWVSECATLTFQDVLDNLHLPWNWDYLSMNPCITVANVISTPDLPWNWSMLSSNPSLTPDDVTLYPDCPWDWEAVCNNINVVPPF